MAIVFTTSLDGLKLIQAYNNNVVRFTSDTVGKVIKKAEISSVDFFSVIYPNPAGMFYFNFKDYFSAAVNTKNFTDDVDYQLDINDPTTIRYNVNDGHFIKYDVSFKIIFEDNSFEVFSNLTYDVLAAVTNLQSFKNDSISTDQYSFCILVPALDRSLVTNLKVWKGYPFEFTYYSRDIEDEISIYNSTNVTSFSYIQESELTSLVLTDGQNEFPFVGLKSGWNLFNFEVAGNPVANVLQVLFEEEQCGIYVKFLNRFGRWTYWLFSKKYFETRSTKYMGEIENDFNNIQDTISPTLQIGKISDGTLKVAAKSITPDFAILLEDIFDSPKIMIFNGVPGEVSTYKNWYETRLKTSSFQLVSPNKQMKNYYLEFDQPLRNTITL